MTASRMLISCWERLSRCDQGGLVLGLDRGRTRTLWPHTARSSQASADSRATVDNDALAGDISPGLGGEENRCSGDLARLADAAQRGHALERGFGLGILPQCAREVGANDAGRNRVDAD